MTGAPSKERARLYRLAAMLAEQRDEAKELNDPAAEAEGAAGVAAAAEAIARFEARAGCETN